MRLPTTPPRHTLAVGAHAKLILDGVLGLMRGEPRHVRNAKARDV